MLDHSRCDEVPEWVGQVDPGSKSAKGEVLYKKTGLPAVMAENGTRLLRNCLLVSLRESGRLGYQWTGLSHERRAQQGFMAVAHGGSGKKVDQQLRNRESVNNRDGIYTNPCRTLVSTSEMRRSKASCVILNAILLVE